MVGDREAGARSEARILLGLIERGVETIESVVSLIRVDGAQESYLRKITLPGARQALGQMLLFRVQVEVEFDKLIEKKDERAHPNNRERNVRQIARCRRLHSSRATRNGRCRGRG